VSRAHRLVCAIVLVLSWQAPCGAHELRPGFFEMREVGPRVFAFLWKPPAGGGGEWEIAPVLPVGCELSARARDSLMPRTSLVRGEVRCERGLHGGMIRIAGLESTFTEVLVRLVHRDGTVESGLLTPSEPAYQIGLVVSWLERCTQYVRLGIEHILLGADHLLFILGLLLLVGGRWALLKTVTAFTVAHSVTLAAATLGYVVAPVPPLNVAIALSILFLAPEILRREAGGTSLTIRHPWAVAFAFGLLHGFGFAGGLASMGLPRSEIPLALVLFNLGVEIGQVIFVVLLLWLARSFRRLEVAWPRPLAQLPVHAIGALGAYWTIDRTVAMLAGAS
jgi:hydrogenase/urease accessory protein HupE